MQQHAVTDRLNQLAPEFLSPVQNAPTFGGTERQQLSEKRQPGWQGVIITDTQQLTDPAQPPISIPQQGGDSRRLRIVTLLGFRTFVG
ncbi:hypothetical protein [Conexibacter sp. S30A1]|uniref:hypothetical protein n=1 Tax=Conexibacter sp. S30A1 TaxID=2937800 RepID=UPI00200ED983|nr:hypothetical protein [Conexibacter sp. S30A1]